MQKKLFIQDVIVIALLYNYEVTNNYSLSLDDILRFYKIISYNLENMNFDTFTNYPMVNYENVYTFSINSIGERICTLNNNFDIDEIKEYIDILPNDVKKASKMSNALIEIGISNNVSKKYSKKKAISELHPLE